MSMSKAKDLFWIKGGSHNLKLNAQRDSRLDLVLKKKNATEAFVWFIGKVAIQLVDH